MALMFLEQEVSELKKQVIKLTTKINELEKRDHHVAHESITQTEAHKLIYGNKEVTSGAISVSMKKLVKGGYIHVMKDGGQNFYDRDEILEYKKSRMMTGKTAVIR